MYCILFKNILRNNYIHIIYSKRRAYILKVTEFSLSVVYGLSVYIYLSGPSICNLHKNNGIREHPLISKTISNSVSNKSASLKKSFYSFHLRCFPPLPSYPPALPSTNPILSPSLPPSIATSFPSTGLWLFLGSMDTSPQRRSCS